MAELLTFTFGELLDNTAERYPDNDALVYPDRGIRYNYRQFNEICRTVAKGLLRLGVRKGDNVAIWANNVPEWVVLQFATAKIGAILVTVNTNYKSMELEYILRQSDSTTLFLVKSFKDTDYIETLYSVAPELPCAEPGKLVTPKLPYLKNVVFIGEETPAGMFNFRRLQELGEAVDDAELAAVEATLHCQDVINMQYTSGTTGFPKGVMLTHYNVVNNGLNIGGAGFHRQRTGSLYRSPSSTVSGCVLGVMACATHGAPWFRWKYSIRSRCCRLSKRRNAPPYMACPQCSSPNWNTPRSSCSTSPRSARASWPAAPARSR